MRNGVCDHLEFVTAAAPRSDGCEDCLAIGARWVHLRRCTTCGHVGCCESSPHRHALSHFLTARHPVIQSYESYEDWLWCYIDRVMFEVPALSPSPSHR